MKPWHAQFYLSFLKQSSREDYCSDRKFKHIDLMFHIDTVSKLQDVNGLIHRGLLHYLRHLYKDHNGGRGHKALFHNGDKNYKEIEAYEKRTMERFVTKLQEQLHNEEKRRLEAERVRKVLELELKELGLQQVNKDKFDEINDLSKNLHDMSLVMKPKTNPTTEEYEAGWMDINSIFHSLRGKCCMKGKNPIPTRVDIPSEFSLQQFMDDWYDHPENDILNLFQPLNSEEAVIKFLYKWNVGPKGSLTAHFFSEVWKQLGDLTVKVKDAQFIKLFERTKGGLVIVKEENFKTTVPSRKNNHVDTDVWMADVAGVDVEAFAKAKACYRAIGRIMIHSLIGNDSNAQTRFPIPSFILPRFYRNLIFRNCGPEDKNEYPWAEVVNDLRDIELGVAIDRFIEQKHDTEEIFTKLIPENFIHPRKSFIDAFREGLNIGGIFDIAGLILKDIPVFCRGGFKFNQPQMKILVQMSLSNSAENSTVVPYFKSLDLDVLGGIIFVKGSITAEDIVRILRVRLNKKNINISDQKQLFQQIGRVIVECSDEDAGFPSRFIEFFTGFTYVPVVEESELVDPFPQPCGKSKISNALTSSS